MKVSLINLGHSEKESTSFDTRIDNNNNNKQRCFPYGEDGKYLTVIAV